MLAACGFGENGDDGSESTPEPTVAVDRVAGYENPNRWRGLTIVVATTEGEYGDAQRATIFEPFERLTGAIVEVQQFELEALRRQVETADVIWSACDLATEEVIPLANSGVLAEIDYSVVDSADLYRPALMDHGVGSSVYSTVLSYITPTPGDPEEEPLSATPPMNWREFWDTGGWPGLRGLRASPETTLEFALLAAGMPVDELYPLDVDLAFKRLDRIRESVILWWEQGAQPAQMLASQDLAMSSVWHNRVEIVTSETDPVLIQWNQGAMSGESWVVPNGAPEPVIAMDLINFATRPEVTAAFSILFPFGPVNSRAFEYIPEEIAELLPTNPNLIDLQFPIDYTWWFIHRESVQPRFEAWLDSEE